jgi:hypothetical protein
LSSWERASGREQAYLDRCRRLGMSPNASHKIENFGLNYIKEVLGRNFQGKFLILHEIELVDEYCFDLVTKKLA